MPTQGQLLEMATKNILEVVTSLPQVFPYIHFEDINLTLTELNGHYIITCAVSSTIRITQQEKRKIKHFLANQLQLRQYDITLHASVLLGLTLHHFNTIKTVHINYYI